MSSNTSLTKTDIRLDLSWNYQCLIFFDLQNLQLHMVQPNKTLKRREMSDKLWFISIYPFLSFNTLPNLGDGAPFPFSSLHGREAAERDIVNKVTSHTGTFILGWPGYVELGHCARGNLNGPEHSQMQVDCNVNGLCSEAQSLCASLGGQRGGASGQPREDEAIWVKIQKNLTECI